MYHLYRITILVNAKKYIGQTIDPRTRWNQHIYESKKEYPSMIINRAMKKHCFTDGHFDPTKCSFEVIACCLTQEQANDLEELLIIQENSHVRNKMGYNVSNGGSNAPKTEEWKQTMRGRKDSEEVRQKKSKAAKQRIIDYPHTNPASYGFTGADLTKESRQKLSDSKKGRMGPNNGREFSNEWRQNLSENHASKKEGYISPNKDKPMSEEQKQKLSKAHTGKKLSEEHRKSLSLAKMDNTNCVGREPWNKGKTGECKFSDEQINQMKELRATGMSYEKIAKIIGCNWKSVVKWIKK